MERAGGRKERRVPIRRRVLLPILGIMLAMMTVAATLCVFFMYRVTSEGKETLAAELKQNLRREVAQKASQTEVMLDTFRGYMTLFRDYTENLYRDREGKIATGRFVDTSRDTHEYALQTAFASKEDTPEEHLEEIYFFSHLEPLLEPLAKGHEKELTTIYLGTKTGLMIAYDRWSYIAAVPESEVYVYDFTKADWYREGLAAEDVFFTSLYADALGRGLTITAATPFRNGVGEVQGVLAADFDITGIYRMISMDLGVESKSFAVDKDGKIISVDEDNGISVLEYMGLNEEETGRLISGGTGLIETADAFYAYAPVRDVNWTLCAVVPRQALMERVNTMEGFARSLMLSFLAVAAVLVVLGILFANRVARTITHPIELLVGDMRVIAEGNLDHRAKAYQNDEIGDMTGRLNEMVDRLKGTIQDLVNAREVADRMSELANRDALTSVRNKGAFAACMQGMQDRVDRGEEVAFAVVIFDCDNLKGINDQYGHDRGDEYIKTISSLICRTYKHSPVFRIGGDEFSVVLEREDYDRREELAEQFEKDRRDACAATENPWERPHAAMGMADYDPRQDRTVAETASRADRIMYEKKHMEKANGGIGLQRVYSMEADDRYWKEQYVSDSFKTALENSWIKVYYQPIVRIGSGNLVALESLARWIDPTRGMIAPGEFIPVLSRLRRLHLLDLYMVEQVCREFQTRMDTGMPLLPVSVNISAQDFDETDVPARMMEIVKKYGLGPEKIIVEITEQEIAEGTEHFREALNQLRAAGFKLWIDDFGSGYSSLSVLSQYAVDRIKIDMELIRHLDDKGGTNRKILEAMIRVCRELGVQTLAEGVETEAQLSFLKMAGCDLAQGYFFFRPESLDASIYKFQHRSADLPVEMET